MPAAARLSGRSNLGPEAGPLPQPSPQSSLFAFRSIARAVVAPLRVVKPQLFSNPSLVPRSAFSNRIFISPPRHADDCASATVTPTFPFAHIRSVLLLVRFLDRSLSHVIDHRSRQG